MAHKLCKGLALGLLGLALSGAAQAAAIEPRDDVNSTVGHVTCRVTYPNALLSDKNLDLVECLSIKVPLDHSQPPGGQTILLRTTRIKAKNQDKCKGALFINIGGPGASSASYLAGLADKLEATPGWATLHEWYDLVGVDNRGTGTSQPLLYNSTLFTALDRTIPADDAAYNRTFAANRAFALSAADMTGPLFHHMGSDSAAADLDLVRAALGHDKLNLLGFSGGTLLAQQYIRQFPSRVGRLVLDGVQPHSSAAASTELAVITSALQSEATLNQFFQWCNTTSDCPMQNHDQPAIFDAVYDRAASGNLTIEVQPGVKIPLPAANLAAQIISSLLSGGDAHGAKPHFFSVLQQLQKGNVSALFPSISSSSSSSEPIRNDTYTISPTPNGVSTASIYCSDRSPVPLTFPSLRNLFAALTPAGPTSQTPHLRGYSVITPFELTCIGWPFPPPNPPPTARLDPATTKSLPPILIVQSFFDPSTAYPFAVDLRAQLPSSVAIYRNGTGHTSFGPYKTITAPILDYLVNGTVPVDGTIYQTDYS